MTKEADRYFVETRQDVWCAWFTQIFLSPSSATWMLLSTRLSSKFPHFHAKPVAGSGSLPLLSYLPLLVSSLFPLQYPIKISSKKVGVLILLDSLVYFAVLEGREESSSRAHAYSMFE